MQHLAVEIRDVVFPERLPAGQDQFFEFGVRGDEDQRPRASKPMRPLMRGWCRPCARRSQP